jgi:hypothetical protein
MYYCSNKSHFTIAVDTAVNIDSDEHFGTFAQNNNLYRPDLWTIERKIDNFPFQSKVIKIIKLGLLQRPKMFGMGFYPVEVVITETGFLHCFKLNNSKNKELLEILTKRNLAITSNERTNFISTDELYCNEIQGSSEFR